ncbi:MAG: hypothetical protein AAF696_29825, partial [Bacteroidota bacterium]
LSKSFKSLHVKNVLLDKGKLQFKQEHSAQLFDLPDLNLRIQNFLVDSSHSHRDRLFYSDNIRLSSQGINQSLSDSLHLLSVATLSLETKDGNLRICGLDIKPKPAGIEEMNQQYCIHVPELSVKGLDLFKLLDERKADLDEIQLDTPKVALERYPDIDKKEIDSLARANLYDFISDQLISLYVKDINIREGNLKVSDYKGGTNELKAEQLNLSVKGFLLDSASASRSNDLFYAQHISVGTKIVDYYFTLPDSSYAIRIGNVGISTADSSIQADNIQLLPQWNNRKLKQSMLAWELEIPRLTMAGIDPDEWYFKKKLNLSKLRLESPIIRQTQLHQKEKEARLDLYPILHPLFEELSIRDLDIVKATFFQENLEENKKEDQKIEGISLKAKNFRLDSLGLIRPERIFYTDDVQLSLGRQSYWLQDSLYKFTFKEARISTQKGYAEVDSMMILPQFDIIAYVSKHGYAQNQLFLQSHKLLLEDIDLYKFLEEERLWIKKATIQGMDFRVKKDQRFKMKAGRRPPFPQEMIRDLPMAIKIDQMDLKGAAINFQAKTAFRNKTGHIYFTDINASLQNICNDSAYLLTHPKLAAKLSAEATIMNSGKLNTRFNFPLLDTLNTYSFTGNLGAWDMTELNPIVIPSARIRIKQGQIKSTNFEVFANKYESRGKMTMRYNDLKVSVLDEKGGEQDAIKRKPLLSAIANTLVVKQDNPNRRFLRYGKIRYESDLEKGFVNHWVQAVLSGVKSSIGMEEVGEKDKGGGLRYRKKKALIP